MMVRVLVGFSPLFELHSVALCGCFHNAIEAGTFSLNQNIGQLNGGIIAYLTFTTYAVFACGGIRALSHTSRRTPVSLLTPANTNFMTF